MRGLRLARTMIEHLGDLLRLSLDARDRQEIPLAEELAFLDHYVAIQKIRITVFVTAYHKHAVRAFEANALDYLLKPFSDERWEAALARAKTRYDELDLREFGSGVLRMLATRSHVGRYLDRLVVKGSGTTRFIRVADIDWIEGAGVYVNLHIAGKELLYRLSSPTISRIQLIFSRSVPTK
jgi:DNA-binding LytR/AlgR family response regulator